MPRPVSQRKLAANRANAKKSTGPRTPAGKARSARNALKHGLLSADVVVAHGDAAERPEDYHALLQHLVHEFDPRDGIEQALVERVAACFWRLRRAQRFEVGALREALDESLRDPHHDQLAKLQQQLHHAHNMRRHHAEDLQFLHALDLDDPPAVENARPMLDKIRLRFSGVVWDLPVPQMCELLLRKLPEYLEAFDNEEIPAIECEIEEARESARLRRERRALTAALPPPQEVLKLVRYENMLDRQLHRALARLDRRRGAPSRCPTVHRGTRGAERNAATSSRETNKQSRKGAPSRCPTVHRGTRGGGRNSPSLSCAANKESRQASRKAKGAPFRCPTAHRGTRGGGRNSATSSRATNNESHQASRAAPRRRPTSPPPRRQPDPTSPERRNEKKDAKRSQKTRVALSKTPIRRQKRTQSKPRQPKPGP